MSFLYSSADHARTVRVRTFPSELTASANLATLSPFGASTKMTRSLSPDVRYRCLISTPTFLASSRAASERFGESLTARIPWSVQLSDIIKVGMRSSLDIVRGDHEPMFLQLQVG